MTLLRCCVAVLLLSDFALAQSAQGVLWRDPGSLAARDLFWGNASEARAPQPPFRFVEEKKTGATAKIVITDARGDTWDVKFGDEAHAEVAAGRLLWAFGYSRRGDVLPRLGKNRGRPQPRSRR